LEPPSIINYNTNLGLMSLKSWNIESEIKSAMIAAGKTPDWECLESKSNPWFYWGNLKSGGKRGTITGTRMNAQNPYHKQLSSGKDLQESKWAAGRADLPSSGILDEIGDQWFPHRSLLPKAMTGERKSITAAHNAIICTNWEASSPKKNSMGKVNGSNEAKELQGERQDWQDELRIKGEALWIGP